jgi:perosamine synthetase
MAITVNEPLLGQQEIEYVTERLRTGCISSAGRFIEQFQERWATYCGRTYGIAVSDGTTALRLAVDSLDRRPGGELTLRTFTITSCAAAVVYGGGVPVLLDLSGSHLDRGISRRKRWRMTPYACH